MRTTRLVGAILAAGIVLACSGEAPTTPTPDLSGPALSEAGMEKTPISGMVAAAGSTPPERVLITPSGRCHFWGLPVFTMFTGDVEGGPVTYIEQINRGCDSRDNMVGSGPVEGEVTWNGLTGTVSGHFTTICKPDISQPVGVSCDGTMNLRGSGDLDGVQFHMKWGPGWYPFPYTGTAFSK